MFSNFLLLEGIEPRKPGNLVKKKVVKNRGMVNQKNLDQLEFTTSDGNNVKVQFQIRDGVGDVVFYVNDTLDDLGGRADGRVDPEILGGVLWVVDVYADKLGLQGLTFSAWTGKGDTKVVRGLHVEKFQETAVNGLKEYIKNVSEYKARVIPPSETRIALAKKLGREPTVVYDVNVGKLSEILGKLMSAVESGKFAPTHEFEEEVYQSRNVGGMVPGNRVELSPYTKLEDLLPGCLELLDILKKYNVAVMSHYENGTAVTRNRRQDLYKRLIDKFFTNKWNVEQKRDGFTLTRKDSDKNTMGESSYGVEFTGTKYSPSWGMTLFRYKSKVPYKDRFLDYILTYTGFNLGEHGDKSIEVEFFIYDKKIDMFGIVNGVNVKNVLDTVLDGLEKTLKEVYETYKVDELKIVINAIKEDNEGEETSGKRFAVYSKYINRVGIPGWGIDEVSNEGSKIIVRIYKKEELGESVILDERKSLEEKRKYILRWSEELLNGLRGGNYFACDHLKMPFGKFFGAKVVGTYDREIGLRNTYYIGMVDGDMGGSATGRADVEGNEGTVWVKSYGVYDALESILSSINGFQEHISRVEGFDAGGVIFAFGEGEKKVLYHELSHVYDLMMRGMKGVNSTEYRWSTRSEEVEAELNALYNALLSDESLTLKDFENSLTPDHYGIGAADGRYDTMVGLLYGWAENNPQKVKISSKKILRRWIDMRQMVIDNIKRKSYSVMEGRVKLPYDDIAKWVDTHIEEIIEKVKESAKKGYQTYIDDSIKFVNQYTGDGEEVSVYIWKDIKNDNMDVLMNYDKTNNTINISAKTVLSRYKKVSALKEALVAGMIHELTHVVDPGRDMKKQISGDMGEYINSPREFPAFANMYIDKIQRDIKSGNILIGDVMHSIRVGKFKNSEINSFFQRLTPDNQRKFINLLYKSLSSDGNNRKFSDFMKTKKG